MKALSQKRRHPLAAVVLLAIALVLTGGLYAVATASNQAQADTAAYTSQDIEQGEKLFSANCATCHGTEAAGTDAGPSLIGVGAAAVDFQIGTGRMPLEMQGVQAQVKPGQFNDEQIKQLAAYVASLGAGPGVPDDEDVDVSKGDAANGAKVFLANCAMCHNAAGAGGALTRGKWAPTLMGVSEKHIWEAMETGPQNMPVFNDANITPEEKRDVITYLKSLETNTTPGGFALGSLGPVSEGLFIWTIGLGIVIAFTVWLTSRSA
ncbi:MULTISPECIES: cytochrome bc1 complex diheme cytochrome c subunit [Rothia]|uniref:Cytochrome bc1 complex cytochrome c subunit n=1 Tax=Rothia kristinae TaxID=37923 RepID=A0A147E7U8_9MICC|nr:cytochrome c [Rothia kristinae]TDP57084.1 menaquinol-cytochrome c reductase cytochrome c1 subunit precursor [Kocuria sp. AG109]KTR38724.1 cystathionine beta-lyase [Rothia kristinae]KTR59055.1 cystathionine beta-lyase [Rothia kristinae]KTR68633.1 cystathionine beta-lyase [Rothia kristinae]KTR73508.1 cystathionine beta-lyase [Rothia kristinae]